MQTIWRIGKLHYWFKSYDSFAGPANRLVLQDMTLSLLIVFELTGYCYSHTWKDSVVSFTRDFIDTFKVKYLHIYQSKKSVYCLIWTNILLRHYDQMTKFENRWLRCASHLILLKKILISSTFLSFFPPPMTVVAALLPPSWIVTAPFTLFRLRDTWTRPPSDCVQRLEIRDTWHPCVQCPPRATWHVKPMCPMST